MSEDFFYHEAPRLVQIVVSGAVDSADIVYGLDNGGRVWRLLLEEGEKWKVLPAVPFGRPVSLL